MYVEVAMLWDQCQSYLWYSEYRNRFFVVVFCCCCWLLFLFFVFVSLLFSLFFSDAAAYLRKDEKTADVGVSVKRIYINSWCSYSHINRCRKGSWCFHPFKELQRMYQYDKHCQFQSKVIWSMEVVVQM